MLETGPLSSDNDIRDLIRTGWDETATAYGQDGTDQFELFGQRLLDRMVLPPQASVLDVGTGTGIVSMLAARQSGGQGRVIGVDLSYGMLAVALVNSRANKLPVGLGQMDAGQLSLKAGAFDAVVCAFSLFQFVDMGQALTEMVRVMKSGGQIGLSNWGPGYFTPVAGMQRDLFREFGLRPLLTNPIVTKPEKLQPLMEAAGLTDIRLEADAVDLWFESPEDVWEYNVGMGPFVIMLRDQLSASQQQKLRERYIEMVSTIASPEGVRCTFHPLYALARKS
jgi:ubiquinone/menaquinone biosynthesis C-methylase UbiE